MGHPACVFHECHSSPASGSIRPTRPCPGLSSVGENDIEINIGPFTPLFTIKTNYTAVSGALPKLQKPTLEL